MPGSQPLGHLLSEAAHLVRTATADRLADLGIEPRDLGLLLLIEEHGPMPQIRLGELHRMDRTTVTKRVDRLEELGLAERRRNPNDRRMQLVALTTAGAKTAARGFVSVVEVERSFGPSLSDLEREQLRALLTKALAEDEAPASPITIPPSITPGDSMTDAAPAPSREATT